MQTATANKACIDYWNNTWPSLVNFPMDQSPPVKRSSESIGWCTGWCKEANPIMIVPWLIIVPEFVGESLKIQNQLSESKRQAGEKFWNLWFSKLSISSVIPSVINASFCWGIIGKGPRFVSGINVSFIQFEFPEFPNEFQSRIKLRVAELVNSITQISI